MAANLVSQWIAWKDMQSAIQLDKQMAELKVERMVILTEMKLEIDLAVMWGIHLVLLKVGMLDIEMVGMMVAVKVQQMVVL